MKLQTMFCRLSLVMACGVCAVLFTVSHAGAQTDPRNPERAQSPKEYLESRLGGKIVKVEKDPSDLLRAVLLIERKDSVTQHVLEATLNSERELEEVRIITTNRNSAGIPPVIVMPLSLAAKCWARCKEKCDQGTECRMGCLFDCIGA
ncbi:MAG: hypothetical protein AB1473_20525 [Thermodesulfobacteriota bacterium]